MNMFELYPNSNVNNLKFKNDKDVIDSSELMGMGLSYWNKILDKMSSKLKLSTALNVGSTFSFAIKVKTKNTIWNKSKLSWEGIDLHNIILYNINGSLFKINWVSNIYFRRLIKA